ncbi:hypothetical protein, partial [Comamonas resistens]|uniref:hypothetical protein n=1 Tax=Comamonas resistens TaxID=3046670 RepID=UPI0039BD711B
QVRVSGGHLCNLPGVQALHFGVETAKPNRLEKTVYPVLQDCALHLLQSIAWQSIENALQNPPSSSITPTSPTPSASISSELNTKAIPIRHGSFNRKQITFNCLTNVDKTSPSSVTKFRKLKMRFLICKSHKKLRF